MIAAIAEKKNFSDRRDIKGLSQISLSLRWLESGFHMIAGNFFLNDHSDRSDHKETGLNLSQ